MDEPDRQRLVGFIYATGDDLSFIFDVAGPYMSDFLVERLWPAWDAVQARRELRRLAAEVDSGQHDEGLDEAGLSGPELDFKLAGVESARAAGRERQTPRLLRRWLKWIDVVLGSLIAVIGVGETVKELKEGVEAELEAADEPTA